MTENKPALKQLIPTAKGMSMSFSGFTVEGVSNMLADFFISRGFTLGSGSKQNGVYETGSSGGRAVLGGFVKRQKYSVSVSGDENLSSAMIQSEMSGVSGSVLGVVRERKGREEMKSALQFFLQSVIKN